MSVARLKSGTHGFTLIELMIGIAIVALVLMLGMPSYSAWIQNTRLRNAAESISNGLQLARQEATRRNTPMQFIMGAGTTWTVACPASADCPVAVPPIEERTSEEGSSTGIIVTPVAPLGAPVIVTFDSFGARATPLAAGIGRIDLTHDTSVLPAAESRPLSITVDVGGNIKMCNPAVTALDDSRRC